FPQHERFGRRGGVPVLEAEAGELGERAVVELERSARAREGLDRRIATPVRRVVQDEVTLAERAALRVLSGEPDRGALAQERRERQGLRVGPLDLAVFEGGAAPLELLQELWDAREAVRNLEELLVQRREERRGNRRLGLGRRRLCAGDPLGLLARSLFAQMRLERLLNVGEALVHLVGFR